jgi:hypothetical protein
MKECPFRCQNIGYPAYDDFRGKCPEDMKCGRDYGGGFISTRLHVI